MSFKEVADLDCSDAIALGGTNRKTGKPNQNSIEGYYLGSRQVASPKSKTGYAALHVFQTNKGNVGVWGKTNLDSKLASVVAGTMTRATFVGMVETKNNPMYKYKVETDASNTIEVSSANTSNSSSDDEGTDSAYDSGYDEESENEQALDEAPVQRASRPAQAALPPSAERQSRVQALLNKGRGAKA